MLSARSIVTLTIVIAVLSIFGMLIALMQTPDSGGRAANSYGTRAYGYRALYEVLEELKLPVRRRLAPPSADLDRDATIVFWAPNPGIIQIEPVYLRAVAGWVRNGGRVVVTPPAATLRRSQPMNGEDRNDDVSAPRDILAELGLPGISVVDADHIATDETESSTDANDEWDDREFVADQRESRGGDFDEFRDSVLRAFERKEIPTRLAKVTATGTLADLGDAVETVEVDVDNLRVIALGDSEPSGTLTISRNSSGSGDATEGNSDESGNQADVLTMVAAYRIGQGEIVVVGDPGFLQNRSIAAADNSVLGVHLFSRAGRPVVFDEFYHGLTIRGNPFWLLTRTGYAMVALCILLVIGLWAWRQSVFLGPPLEPEKVKRRSIMEYVEAMSRFLIRGRASYSFLLQEVREGVLHSLRHQLNLPPGSETPEQVSAVLARRDPQRAERFVAAVAAVDEAIASQRHVSEKQTVQAMQRISDCL